MKRLFLLIAFIAISFIGNTQQSATPYSIFVYQFKKLNIILTNESMVDSSIKSSPKYIQFPFQENVFAVYGLSLTILVTTLQEPFRSAKGHISIDTSSKDSDKMKLEDLEVRITTHNNEHFQDWKDVNKFYSVKDSSFHLQFTRHSLTLKPGIFYRIADQWIMANDIVKVALRNKKTKEELIHFRFMGIGKPIAPVLSVWSQDSSSTKNITSFVEHELPVYTHPLESLDRANQYQKGEYGKKLKNEKLQPSPKLALYFRRPGPDYPDSSMEYRLLSKAATDTAWHKTGHKLLFTRLNPGTRYTLQIRYLLHPSAMQEHSFYVVPKWYQTTINKIIIVISLALLLMFLLLVIYRRRVKKTKEKIERQNLEIKSIRSQLNPHFVFNALSSIQGLINKNDITGANHYLTEFSSLLRESLRNNDKELIPLEIELKILETYLKLEQLRFHFHYEIDIDNRIDKNAVEIPALLLQPLIENAIKHGVSSLNEKGLVQIRFANKNNDLTVSVIDNGNGFANNTPASGFGLKLTKDRILLLNQTLKNQPIELSIESSENTGTTVHLVFKNWL